MTVDVRSTKLANQIVTTINKQQQNSPTHFSSKTIYAKHIQVEPIPITFDYFYTRSHGKISLEQSKLLQNALLDANYLDKDTLLLIDDPRNSNWRSVIQEHVDPNADTLVAKASTISALFNVAYGEHDTTRNGILESLQYCLEIVNANAQ